MNKLNKIATFLDNPNFEKIVPNEHDRVLLQLQRLAMISYNEILIQRIAKFNHV